MKTGRATNIICTILVLSRHSVATRVLSNQMSTSHGRVNVVSRREQHRLAVGSQLSSMKGMTSGPVSFIDGGVSQFHDNDVNFATIMLSVLIGVLLTIITTGCLAVLACSHLVESAKPSKILESFTNDFEQTNVSHPGCVRVIGQTGKVLVNPIPDNAWGM